MPLQEHTDYEARQLARDAISATANLRELFEEKNNGIREQLAEVLRRLGLIEERTRQEQKEVSGWKEKGYIAFGGTFFGATCLLLARVLGLT